MTVPARRGSRIGIDTVALAAGVSRQTVSNVLSDRGRFTPDTRQRVLEEVRRLGYRPHRGAQSLRSRQSRQLAFPLSPALLRSGNVIMAQFLQAVVAAATERDHSVLVSAAGTDTAAHLRELVAGASVDAFVVADTEHDDPRIAYLCAAGVPFGCFGRTAPGLPQCWVDIDNGAGMRSLVAHLAERKHQRLAYLGYAGPGYWDDERAAGFRAGMADADLIPDERLVRRTTDADAHRVADRLLAGRRPPTAILTGSDALASVVYDVARARGLVVGADLAVTGFDGGAVGRSLVPSLTTIAMPLTAIARAVVDRALAEFTGASRGAPGELVAGELIVGESTASTVR